MQHILCAQVSYYSINSLTIACSGAYCFRICLTKQQHHVGNRHLSAQVTWSKTFSCGENSKCRSFKMEHLCNKPQVFKYLPRVCLQCC